MAQAQTHNWLRIVLFLLLGFTGACGGEDLSVLEELGETDSALTAQNDMGSGRDASNSLATATPPAVLSGSGQLGPWDWADYYKVSVSAGQTISLSMTPPSTVNFNLYLYRPNGTRAASSTRGAGLAEAISFVADAGGDWRVLVFGWSRALTSYGLTIAVSGPEPDTEYGDCGIASTSGPSTIAFGDLSAAASAMVMNFGESAVDCMYHLSVMQSWGSGPYYSYGIGGQGNLDDLAPGESSATWATQLAGYRWHYSGDPEIHEELFAPGDYAVLFCAFDRAAYMDQYRSDWLPIHTDDLGRLPVDADPSNTCMNFVYTITE